MAEANSIIGKMIITIVVELEREVTDIQGEVCRRIAMHPHVRDANVVMSQFVKPIKGYDFD